jgi:hypothetical protein
MLPENYGFNKYNFNIFRDFYNLNYQQKAIKPTPYSTKAGEFRCKSPLAR